MKKMSIMLGSIEDVKEFVALTNSYAIESDLVSGRYAVDAKSIMGIFSLDLLNPITLTAYGDDCDKLFDELKDYIVE